MKTPFYLKYIKTTALWLLLICIYAIPEKCLASHVLGGEISYKETGKDTFLVRFTLYTDCGQKNNPFGPTLQFKSNCGGATVNIGGNLISSKEITPVCKKSCTTCYSDTCKVRGIKALTYESYAILSAYNCQRFTFSVASVCCRSGSITTGLAASALYLEAFVDKSSDQLQSSPQFSSYPLFIAPLYTCMSFSNGAVANNGDSLVYKIIDPKRGPGSMLSFNDGYSKDKPLIFDGYPDNTQYWDAPKKCMGFYLNPRTGLLQFKAKQEDITVIDMEVEQWKKDTSGKAYLAGSTQRESVVAVIDNSSNKSPILTGVNGTSSTELINCFGDSANFTIYSFDPDGDSVQLSYEHEITGAKIEITKGKYPKLIFKWLPDSAALRKGSFDLLVNAKANNCPYPSSASRAFRIKIIETYDAKGIKKEYTGCKTYRFSANATSPTKTYKWYVNNYQSSTDSVFSNTFYDSINYIKLLVDGYCVLNGTDSVIISPSKMGVVSNKIDICKGQSVKLEAYGGHKYFWKENGDTTSSITVTPTNLWTNYFVDIIDTVTKCTKFYYILVTITNDCVWPGDANNDGNVGQRDLLYIGIGNGISGIKQDSAKTDWLPQYAHNWTQKTDSGILNPINYKHFDTDGNGLINEADTFAISKNYGKGVNFNNNLTGQNLNAAPVYFSFSKDTFYAGEKVEAYLHLGKENHILDPMYGAAWSFRYQSDIIVPGSEKIELLCDDFCAGNAPYISLLKNTSGFNVEFAIVRMNHIPLFAQNPVLKIEFLLKDSNYNYTSSGKYLMLEHQDGLILDINGKVVNYNAIYGLARVFKEKPLSINPPQSILHNINIYPNPASSQIIISGYSEAEIGYVTITNALGQVVIQQKLQPNQTLKLDVKHFATGLYMVSVKNDEKQTVKNLIINR